MDFKAYEQIDAVNFSRLKHAAKSALHYKHAVETPDEDSTGRAKGRLLHAALLDPDSLLRDFVVWDGDRRGKAFAAFAEQHPHQTIIKADEYDATIAQRNAVLAHPEAGKLLRFTGECEKTITWRDEETGLDCKGRLDKLLTDGSGAILDLKGTPTVEAGQFGAVAARQLYYAQLGFYRMGCHANGIDTDRAALIAVETSAPWDVAVFWLSDDDLWAGEVKCKEWLRTVAAGRFSGRWTGRYPEAQQLRLPAWAFPETAEDDGLDLLVNGQEVA